MLKEKVFGPSTEQSTPTPPFSTSDTAQSDGKNDDDIIATDGNRLAIRFLSEKRPRLLQVEAVSAEERSSHTRKVLVVPVDILRLIIAQLDLQTLSSASQSCILFHSECQPHMDIHYTLLHMHYTAQEMEEQLRQMMEFDSRLMAVD